MNPLLSFAIGKWELILITTGVAILAFWIWMIVDCALYERRPGVRVTWLLVILFGWIIGAPLYYVARKLPRYWKDQKAPPIDLASR